jgi:predicted RNase H-like HicB family nuclease
MATSAKAQTRGGAAGTSALPARERRELERQIAALEAELEAWQDALVTQKLHLRRGYLCTLFHIAGEGWTGDCPALHAGSQGKTEQEASHELDDAIEAVIEFFAQERRELPPPDVALDVPTATSPAI